MTERSPQESIEVPPRLVDTTVIIGVALVFVGCVVYARIKAVLGGVMQR